MLPSDSPRRESQLTSERGGRPVSEHVRDEQGSPERALSSARVKQETLGLHFTCWDAPSWADVQPGSRRPTRGLKPPPRKPLPAGGERDLDAAGRPEPAGSARWFPLWTSNTEVRVHR